jgi:hypothetical protein
MSQFDPSYVFTSWSLECYFNVILPSACDCIIRILHCFLMSPRCVATLLCLICVQKRAVRYTAGLKPLESCRDSFKQLKILTVYLLYILQTILYVSNKCNCTVNKQIHSYNTRNNSDFHYVCIIWNSIPENPQLQVVFFIINCQIV